MHQFTKKHNWQIDIEYVDLASPGSAKGRPIFDQLLHDASEHRFACLVVAKIAHFASSAEMLYRRLRFLESHGVRFVAASDSIDTQDESLVRGGEMLLRVGRACLGFDSELRQ